MHTSMDGNKAVFLDRDGTINVDKYYLYKKEDFEYIDGAVEGLRYLCEMGYLLIIITNQSGIARGYYSEEDYHVLDSWLKNDLKNKGVMIAKSYYCPHLPEGKVKDYATECICRKPKTALFWQAQKELNINMNLSYAIGDKVRDLCICSESGVKGILLGNKNGADSRYHVCSNWKEITEYINNGTV